MVKASFQFALFVVLFLFAIGLEVQAIDTSFPCQGNSVCLEQCVKTCDKLRLRLWECKSGFCICECYPPM
ncbi:unnamed protein product [Lupinus luteus]|uniref:Uncharacterized protein n=1 Tax=Lupinus luteus TaxID=3873 RepID=A0AAV1W7J3_LUPLU